MSIFGKVTLNSLKKNKVRTAVTIIGIMLSAAMICAVTTFVSSMYNYAYQNAVYREGDWHGSSLDGEWSVYEKIISSEKIEKAVYGEQLGYAIAEGSQNTFKPYIYILGASDGFENTMPVHITSGRYPKSNAEILLPAHLSENGLVYYSLGDTLTLQIGDRVSEGYKLWQNTPYYVYENGEEVPADEELAVRETRAYTVVGFYERPEFEGITAPGYTALTLADNSPNTDRLYSVWFKMKNAADVYDFMGDLSLSGEWNSSVLTYSGISRYAGFGNMVTSLAAIVIGLIMFGSVSLIYNAFSISVSERTKQFGLLSSVGATKKQLRRMVIFEALAVSAVGIPLGIIVGIGGIAVTLLLIGHKFESLMGYSIPLRVNVSLTSVIIAVVVALVTVLISAWIPSKRATRISAVEAIRQNLDINAKGRQVKTSKLTYKLFGLSGMLASKYYKRSKKKYRATVVSLFMSIVLFVSASAFTDYLMLSVDSGFNAETFDIIYRHGHFDNKITDDELLAQFKADDAVTDAAYVAIDYQNLVFNKEALTEAALQNDRLMADKDENTQSSKAKVYSQVMFVDDVAYKQLLKAHGLTEAEYLNPKAPKAVAIDGNTYFDNEIGKYVDIKALKRGNITVTASLPKAIDGYYCRGILEKEINGNYEDYVCYKNENDALEEIELPVSEALEKRTLSIGAVIYERPFYIQNNNAVMLLYPISLKNYVYTAYGDEWMGDFNYYYYFTSSNHSESFTAVKNTLSENGLSSGGVSDYAASQEGERNIVLIIQVFAYGFIVLISLIAAANVFNTISTNISLRRREFAMLKSVGMTAKGFNRMMNFECLLYGTRSLLYGLPVSAGVTYLIYLAVSEGYTTGFYLPWVAIGIAVLSVFAVVFVTMMYSMRKIKKENPIDALKNENL